MEIPPFSTIQVHGITKVNGHDRKGNLIVEPRNNRCYPSVVVVPSYANLRPGYSKVNISLRNVTSKKIIMKAKSIVAQVAAANIVPPMLSPKNLQE